jgi:TnpA family transposase
MLAIWRPNSIRRQRVIASRLSAGVRSPTFRQVLQRHIDRIIATPELKEMSQSTLVRKLCALSQHDPTRNAVFEFDELIRSIYTLDYLRDPQIAARCPSLPEPYRGLREPSQSWGPAGR